MSYYETIDEDLKRARQILERGKVHEGDLEFGGFPLVQGAKVVGGTIYGVDTYAAYKLLESFVAEIDRLRALLPVAELPNVSQIEYTVCKRCGRTIDAGMCGYGCDLDGLMLAERQLEDVEVRTYTQTSVRPLAPR